jgi:hypothetical protein
VYTVPILTSRAAEEGVVPVTLGSWERSGSSSGS